MHHDGERNSTTLRDWQLRILGRAGLTVPAGGRVLDFGCGEGGLVDAWHSAGFDAYGCDLADEVGDGSRLAAIEDPYRVPYPDQSFDLVVSNMVFEHVQNPKQAFAEIARVLRPSGASLHQFPSRYKLFEPHTHVPLGTLIRARPWLWLWALAGVRNEFQRDLSPGEIVARNANYLPSSTRYLRRREIVRCARPSRVRFIEREAIETSDTRLGALSWLGPTFGRVYGALRVRVLLLTPAGGSAPP